MSPTALWEIDVESGAFTMIANAAEAMFGYPAAAWAEPGWFWRVVVHPEDRDAARTHCLAAVRAGVDHGARYRCVTAAGRVVCVEHTASVRAVSERTPRAVVRGVLVDVTEWRAAERRARLAQRLEVIGRLTGGVAHDFNNVLTAVRLYSELLLDALGDDVPPTPEALRRDVEEIRRAADRASALTRQLLAFSRAEAPDVRPLDVGAAVAALVPMLRRLIAVGVTLDVHVPNGAATALADAGQLEQIVLNLCLNARDAMPDGGTLTLATAGGVVRDRRRWVTLTVHDTGAGMDEATRARAFEPFFTTKTAGEGTGLGLATVAEIVEQSGGIVELESAPGVGTTVTVWLPQVDAGTTTTRGPQAPNAERPPARRGTILLVEDEPSVRAGLQRVLDRHGYTVLAAANGVEALDRAATYAAPIHLVLTDLMMPEMGGAELAERLGVTRPDTPVVFVSGHASDVAMQGENAFVPKPISSEQVLRVVESALAGSGV